jgi:hypothetical protein
VAKPRFRLDRNLVCELVIAQAPYRRAKNQGLLQKNQAWYSFQLQWIYVSDGESLLCKSAAPKQKPVYFYRLLDFVLLRGCDQKCIGSYWRHCVTMLDVRTNRATWTICSKIRHSWTSWHLTATELHERMNVSLSSWSRWKQWNTSSWEKDTIIITWVELYQSLYHGLGTVKGGSGHGTGTDTAQPNLIITQYLPFWHYHPKVPPVPFWYLQFLSNMILQFHSDTLWFSSHSCLISELNLLHTSKKPVPMEADCSKFIMKSVNGFRLPLLTHPVDLLSRN